jgi:TPR repeat protein/peptidoglycan hydrolase-like protein with peptidoglycan-binding domain
MSGSKNVGAIAGVTVVAMAASALLAFATIDPPPLPVKQKKTEAAALAVPPTTLPRATLTPAAVTPVIADPPAPKPAAKSASSSPSAAGQPAELSAVTFDELRSRAAKNEIPAMEELARRLLQGIDIAKDPQAGTGWLLRAAELGSASSAFNIGVMYERGFVVERDSSKAAVWYRKAADEGLPVAKHNLALLLRDGKGTPRDVKAAARLLLSAARQGMAASMFTLGDIYEQGDGGAKDPAAALAWFAITGEFERQTSREADSTLARTAAQRAQALRRTLTTAELEAAQEIAQVEFKQIVSALTPPPSPSGTASAAPPTLKVPPPPAPPPPSDALLDWPKGTVDQIRAIQQALVDLKRLRAKPDGNLGPLTHTAIRDFQKSVGMKQTGDPSRDLYVALVSARHDVVRDSPLPAPPPTSEAPKNETPKSEAQAVAEPPKVEAKIEPKIEPKLEPKPAPAPTPPPAPPPPPAETKIDLGKTEPPPPPPTSAEIAAAASPPPLAPLPPPKRIDLPPPPPVVIDTAPPPKPKIEAAKPAPPPAPPPAPKPVVLPPVPAPPPPPTSAEIARSTPKPKPDPDAWPASHADQVKAIQKLLLDLRFYTKKVDGQASGGTQRAIRDYERMIGLKETGEPSKAVFDSLKEMRKLMAPTPAPASN